MITVFYDGKCGLCRREIDHYKRIAPVGVFEWADINTVPESFTVLGYKVADGLKALHVRDAAGHINIGVDAFIVIWRALPRWHVLAAMISLPFIRPLAQKSYDIFAAWRFKKMGYLSCDI